MAQTPVQVRDRGGPNVSSQGAIPRWLNIIGSMSWQLMRDTATVPDRSHNSLHELHSNKEPDSPANHLR